jgi:hypothetical protein
MRRNKVTSMPVNDDRVETRLRVLRKENVGENGTFLAGDVSVPFVTARPYRVNATDSRFVDDVKVVEYVFRPRVKGHQKWVKLGHDQYDELI